MRLDVIVLLVLSPGLAVWILFLAVALCKRLCCPKRGKCKGEGRNEEESSGGWLWTPSSAAEDSRPSSHRGLESVVVDRSSSLYEPS